jgi:hypothetical protein
MAAATPQALVCLAQQMAILQTNLTAGLIVHAYIETNTPELSTKRC